MNNFSGNLFTIFGKALLLCIFLFWMFIRAERIHRFQAAIPEKLKLEINSVVLQGEESTPLIFAIIPSVVRGESCGGGVFRLSKSTINAIESEGLDFFKDATQSRNRKNRYPTWHWQRTPVPDTWTSNGAWPALFCITNGNTSRLIRRITKTSELPGSYYAGSPNSTLLVLPKLGLVVYGYLD
jgi:hypothetical protein